MALVLCSTLLLMFFAWKKMLTIEINVPVRWAKWYELFIWIFMHLFSSFSQDKYRTKKLTVNRKSVGGVQTRDRRMAGADGSTVLWRPLPFEIFSYKLLSKNPQSAEGSNVDNPTCTFSVKTSKSFASVQADGNFMLFDGEGGFYSAWGTNTGSNYLKLQSDGNLIVFKSSGAVVRATNAVTSC